MPADPTPGPEAPDLLERRQWLCECEGADDACMNCALHEAENTIAARDAKIERLTAALACAQRNMADTGAAMAAMRNDINQYVAMPSIEGDLLQGPENHVFCSAVAESVTAALAATERERDAAVARAERAEAALRKLRAEVGGLSIAEDEIRAAIGNTNWNCLQHHAANADAALAAQEAAPDA